MVAKAASVWMTRIRHVPPLKSMLGVTMELPGPSGRLGRRGADMPILTQRWVWGMRLHIYEDIVNKINAVVFPHCSSETLYRSWFLKQYVSLFRNPFFFCGKEKIQRKQPSSLPHFPQRVQSENPAPLLIYVLTAFTILLCSTHFVCFWVGLSEGPIHLQIQGQKDPWMLLKIQNILWQNIFII